MPNARVVALVTSPRFNEKGDLVSEVISVIAVPVTDVPPPPRPPKRLSAVSG